VERFFDYMEIPKDKKNEVSRLQIIGRSLCLVGAVATHTDAIKKRDGTNMVKYETTLQSRYLLTDYEQILFQQYQDCKQGSRPV
jgi:hypothetical protein